MHACSNSGNNYFCQKPSSRCPKISEENVTFIGKAWDRDTVDAGLGLFLKDKYLLFCLFEVICILYG